MPTSIVILYSYLTLVVGIASILMGILVVLYSRRLLNRIWLFLCLMIGGWNIGYFVTMVSSISKSTAIASSRISHACGIFIVPLFLHFVLTLTNSTVKKRKILFLCYLSCIIVVFFSFTDFIVTDLVEKLSIQYYPVGRTGYALYVFLFLFWIIITHFYMLDAYKKSKSHARNQLRYFLAGTTLGFTGGACCFPLIFDIQFWPIASILIFVYPFTTTYAILRHRLMDIELVIRETAIFAGIFGFSIGLFMLVIAAGEQVLQPYIGQSRWAIPALSLLLVTFAIRPIEKLVYGVVGKYLFRKKFEYQKTLQDAAEGMSKIRNPKKLLNLIVHIISSKLKLTGVSVLLYDSKQERYRMKASRGAARDKFISLSSENPLISWLSEKKKPLTLEEVQRWAGNVSGRGSLGILQSDLLQIQDRMQDLNAAVCVPCFFRDELLGVLVLGEKKTGDLFSQDDLDLFSALSDEAAIALKNSQLYFEIDKKANELEALYKREHRLFMHASIAFAAAIDARDSYTHGHSERVTNISLAILDYIGPAEEVDENPLFRQRLQIAAVLHDVGKIGVPDDILHKPEKLSPKEEKQMQKHPTIGADIVSHIKGLRDLIGGIKYHHERYDGKGYPEGLKSDEIPFMAKIISVADTFDAMTSDRPYRKGLDNMIAREEIQKNAASQFDPFMVAAFLKAFEEGKVK